MAKLQDQILAADLVIGDVTGNNPNVFYELGLAHANDKPVIFLTQDDPKDAPIDIRAFELVKYKLENHHQLLKDLDNAINTLFGQKYEELFEKAKELLAKFNADTGLTCQSRTLENFRDLVIRQERASGIPSSEQEDLLVAFLIPLITDFTDSHTMEQFRTWST